jgi:hypothetical protein
MSNIRSLTLGVTDLLEPPQSLGVVWPPLEFASRGAKPPPRAFGGGSASPNSFFFFFLFLKNNNNNLQFIKIPSEKCLEFVRSDHYVTKEFISSF